jgi:predicted TIM-barrel enzyme
VKYSRDHIAQIAERLDAKPDLQKERLELTTKETIGLLSKKLKVLVGKGYSHEEIAKMLTAENVKITAATLKTYMPKAKISKKRESKDT